MLDFASWLLFAATGRILIYVWQLFPLPPVSDSIQKKYIYRFVEKLHRCDLCSGVWVFAILAVALQLDLFGMNNVVTRAVTGAITSYLVHIFMIGAKEKFAQPIVIQ